jgi:hypothetical protein
MNTYHAHASLELYVTCLALGHVLALLDPVLSS